MGEDATVTIKATAAAVSFQPIPRLEQPLPVRIWRGVSNPLRFLSELEQQFGDIVTLPGRPVGGGVSSRLYSPRSSGQPPEL